MKPDKLSHGEIPTLSEIDFPLEWGFNRLPSGKVRERFLTPDGELLLVTTDRISAFDKVLGDIPHKGQVLNRMSAWWFNNTADVIPNHRIATPDPNVMVCKPANALPVEVVVRGVMKGVSNTSIWKMYSEGRRDMYGVHFREGYQYGDLLDEPIITPTTKAVHGHDEPISEAEIVRSGLVDKNTWEQTRTSALNLFTRAQQIANKSGFLLVDTKIEFGLDSDGNLMVIDELFTPDSSGFWALDSDRKTPDIYDKEYLRIKYKNDLGYSGQESIEPPAIPADLKTEISRRYTYAFEAITGEKIQYNGEHIQNRIVQNVGAYYAR